MSESETLKPCPFCGGESVTDKDVIEDGKRGWSARCHNYKCEMVEISTPYYDTEAEAITAWNTRAGEHAAYERGRAVGAEAERGRAKEALHELSRQEQFNERESLMYFKAIDDAINIVNNPPVPIVCIECGNPPLYVYGGQGMCRECADKQRK